MVDISCGLTKPIPRWPNILSQLAIRYKAVIGIEQSSQIDDNWYQSERQMLVNSLASLTLSLGDFKSQIPP